MSWQAIFHEMLFARTGFGNEAASWRPVKDGLVVRPCRRGPAEVPHHDSRTFEDIALAHLRGVIVPTHSQDHPTVLPLHIFFDYNYKAATECEFYSSFRCKAKILAANLLLTLWIQWILYIVMIIYIINITINELTIVVTLFIIKTFTTNTPHFTVIILLITNFVIVKHYYNIKHKDMLILNIISSIYWYG